MDLRTGRMYTTREEALAAGVPESDLAYFVMAPAQTLDDMPIIQFSTGPFKHRQYKRDPRGQLVRVDRKHLDRQHEFLPSQRLDKQEST